MLDARLAHPCAPARRVPRSSLVVRPPARRAAGRLARHARWSAASFVVTRRRVRRPARRAPSDDRSLTQTLFTWIPSAASTSTSAFLRRPAVDHDGAVRHRHRHADPPVLDRLHARRREVLEVLPLPEPVRLLDADARARRQPAAHVPRLGGRRRLLVLPDLVLVRPARRTPSAGKKAFVTNRVGDLGFMVAMFLTFVDARHRSATPTCSPGAPTLAHDDRHGHRAAAVPRRRAASRRSCRCTSGCPTPWPARRRSRR